MPEQIVQCFAPGCKFRLRTFHRKRTHKRDVVQVRQCLPSQDIIHLSAQAVTGSSPPRIRFFDDRGYAYPLTQRGVMKNIPPSTEGFLPAIEEGEPLFRHAVSAREHAGGRIVETGQNKKSHPCGSSKENTKAPPRLYQGFSLPATLSILRPLARRAQSTRRPPGVCMRARNPCVRSRLRQRR